jgi:hypothetical protein
MAVKGHLFAFGAKVILTGDGKKLSSHVQFHYRAERDAGSRIYWQTSPKADL